MVAGLQTTLSPSLMIIDRDMVPGRGEEYTTKGGAGQFADGVYEYLEKNT